MFEKLIGLGKSLSGCASILSVVIALAALLGFGAVQAHPLTVSSQIVTNDFVTGIWTKLPPSGLSVRGQHSAVWTGNEMIIWGGYSGDGIHVWGDGARYNPSSKSWTSVSTTNAPSARSLHTAVWTGSEMIVWGGTGTSNNGDLRNDGARYNPYTDTWMSISTSNAPSARSGHTAVWTGSEMLIWGSGYYLNTGGRYNPVTDTWVPMSNINAPSKRVGYSVVWTGSEMIVWGGKRIDLTILNDGARYNPSTDTWTSISTIGAPVARNDHSAVWSGNEMIVWGGGGDTGLIIEGTRYNPVTGTWNPVTTNRAPSARWGQSALWTGDQMLVWGGWQNTGGAYNPTTNSWTTLPSIGAPAARLYHSAIWTGNEMIVWGGYDGQYTNFNDGGSFIFLSSSIFLPSVRK